MGIETIAIAGLILSAAGTVSSIANAQEQKKEARKQRRTQEQQAALQRRLQESRMRREERIRRAETVARQGATGTTGTSVEGQLIGGQTALQTNLDFSEQQARLQDQQFESMMNQQISDANANIAAAIGSFSATAFSPSGAESGATNIESAFGIGRG